MNVLNVRNVHRALPMALHLLHACGEERQSRNGPVLVAGNPVTTVYEKPMERVMFWPQRDANPFFHFFESLWMLGGCADVERVQRYTKQIAAYSDDGSTFWGAYGARWRVGDPHSLINHSEEGTFDQLRVIADALGRDHDDRRQVLQIWDARSDLGRDTKDVPCNLTATFQVNSQDELDMHVFNRSNDIVWGCYGANAVHFSYLLEYVARRARLAVGRYWQLSMNWHGYRKTFDPLFLAMDSTEHEQLIDEPCPYELGTVTPYPLMQSDTDPTRWDVDLLKLLRSKGRAPSEGVWCDPFFRDVAVPIMRAHDAYKDQEGLGRYESALAHLEHCHATDWRAACVEWLTRRYVKAQREVDDGAFA